MQVRLWLYAHIIITFRSEYGMFILFDQYHGYSNELAMEGASRASPTKELARFSWILHPSNRRFLKDFLSFNIYTRVA